MEKKKLNSMIIGSAIAGLVAGSSLLNMDTAFAGEKPGAPGAKDKAEKAHCGEKGHCGEKAADPKKKKKDKKKGACNSPNGCHETEGGDEAAGEDAAE